MSFFDFRSGGYTYDVTDNVGFNSSGDVMSRVGKNIAIGMGSGNLYYVPNWGKNKGQKDDAYLPEYQKNRRNDED